MTASPSAPRWTTVVPLVAVAAMYLAGLAGNPFVDLDVWHEMALVREATRLGHLPRVDVFAYTPTVEPSVHHEWATGAVLHWLASWAGGPGVMALRHGLAAVIAVLCVVAARRAGAGWAVLCPLLPVGIFPSWVAFSPVRAQLFTLVMTAFLLLCADLDRRGRRWWIAPWLLAYVAWVNLHGGFVVGLALFGMHGVEQLLRRQPVWHLLGLGAAMVALVAVNPYGLDYYPFLRDALTLEREHIPEWSSVLHAWPPAMWLYFFSLLLVVYAVVRTGPRRLPGLLLVLLTAYAAFRHQRHLSLYAVTWACLVPAYVQATPLGTVLDRLTERHRRVVTAAWALVAVVCTAGLVGHRPWHLGVPANPGEYKILFPVGAVQHLGDVGFEGNLMTSYTAGSYVSWKLHPRVRVSLDSRYEVAYPPRLLDEHLAFYRAEDGWESMLDRYSHDLVLILRTAEVSPLMPDVAGWRRVYVDDAYELYARDGVALPERDRRGDTLAGEFP
ncbi:MAG: hypothetical protein ACYTG1_13990 [Planctomycetota bacterium]|jgi:hypothetical protein